MYQVKEIAKKENYHAVVVSNDYQNLVQLPDGRVLIERNKNLLERLKDLGLNEGEHLVVVNPVKYNKIKAGGLRCFTHPVN